MKKDADCFCDFCYHPRMTDDQIIDFIKDLIFDKHRTQKEIAAELGVSRALLWSILSKKHAISKITRERFERYAKKVSALNP